MDQNIPSIPMNDKESDCITCGVNNDNADSSNSSNHVLLNDNSDLNETSNVANIGSSLQNNKDILPPLESCISIKKQLLNEVSLNNSLSTDADKYETCKDQDLDIAIIQKNPEECDDESCTSSNDSMIELNNDNLSLDSLSSQDSRHLDYSSQSKKEKHNEQEHLNGLIKDLEVKNSSLEKEILELQRKLTAQEIAFVKTESQMRTELLSNIEKLSKECNVLRKDKETMVIRYANSEKEVIIEKKSRQEIEKKIKDITKERDQLSSKIKTINTENNRLSSMNESKMIDIAKLQKNYDKLNSDFNAREIKIKWLQNNLKAEMMSHQETQVKLDHTMQRLNEMKEEAEQLRKDCQEMIKCYQEDEEIKSVKLDSQLKQKLSELEVQKQEKSDQEQVYQLLRQELEALKKKQRMTMEENSELTLKIHNLEKHRLEYEQNLSKLRDSQNTLKQENVDLAARLAEMETLQLQLEREKEKSAASAREIERLRSTNAELQADMNACHIKEGELLKFTEGVTDTNVKLQSAYSLLEIKVQALEDELSETKLKLKEFEEKYSQSVCLMEKIRKEHEEENQLLARKLAEKIKNVERLNVNLDEAENENRVLKRRHIASIKELSRELYECKRKLDGFETVNGVKTETSSLGSRTSSAASLDVANSNENRGNANFIPSSPKCSNGKASTDEKVDADLPGIDKEMLIEKIIKLQKQLVAKNERIDFLKDHVVHLVREMRKQCNKCDD